MKIYILLCFAILSTGCGITVEKVHSGLVLDQSTRLAEHKRYFVEPEYDYIMQEEGPALLAFHPSQRETKIRDREGDKMKEKFALAFEKVLQEGGLTEDSENYDLHIIYFPRFETFSRPAMPLESKMFLTIWGYDVRTKKRVFDVEASYEINHNFTTAVIEDIVRQTMSELEYFN